MSILENPLLVGAVRVEEPNSWPFMEKRRTLRVQTINTRPTRTKTDMAAACDINNILKDYGKTGLVAQRQGGMYEALPDAIDYHAAMNLTREAEASFQSLPAKLRDRFQNDPQSFLRFMADPQNRQEAEQLGIIERKRPDEVPEAPQPSEPPPAPSDGK